MYVQQYRFSPAKSRIFLHKKLTRICDILVWHTEWLRTLDDVIFLFDTQSGLEH